MKRAVQDHEILSAVFAKMDVPAMTVAAGVLCSLLLFIATATLLLQTVPEGYPVGPHLATLGHYLPGFEVTWRGACIGALYGFLIGAIGGFMVAVYWNLTHYIALGVMLISSAELAD
ncbi:MAG: hypothetical protein KDI17_17325 [Halioglobus sp.]|nr:hypothetical protein [Halioglobus sp.]